MTRAMTFCWRGEPIEDIETWAYARDEKMVDYIAVRNVLCPVTLTWTHEEYKASAPASFFDNLTMANGWVFHMVHRRAPRIPE